MRDCLPQSSCLAFIQNSKKKHKAIFYLCQFHNMYPVTSLLMKCFIYEIAF